MSDAINILGNDIAGLVDKVLDADTTSKSNDKQNQQIPSKRPHLPVLIIPGFMSSGLEVKQSSIKPKWENERLWVRYCIMCVHIMCPYHMCSYFMCACLVFILWFHIECTYHVFSYHIMCAKQCANSLLVFCCIHMHH